MSDNDWLKYNASEYTVNGVTYRNLEAQVLKNKEDIENITDLSEEVANLETAVAGKQDTLVSGTNIKTVNSNSLLGSGNVSIPTIPSGGADGQVLKKTSNSDYDVGWEDESGGGGGSTKYHTFNSDLIKYRNGMAYAASLSGTDTAQTLYEEFTNGDTVVLIDSVGVIAFVNKASYNSGTDTYTVDVHGFATYFDYTPPHQFYGQVTSASQTFSDNNWFDLNTDKWVTRTIILPAADWVSGGGGTYIDQQVTCTGMTTGATVWVSPVPTQTSTEDYAQYKIICTAQSAGYLTFTSYQTTVPTNDISVNVVFKR